MSNIIPYDATALQQAGQAANQAASHHVFDEYRSRRPENTLRAQDSDLKLFGEYLGSFDIFEWDWSGITWGLVQGFVKWMLQSGFALTSVNRALSTIKVYARLASQAGLLSTEELVMIRSVQGYKHSDKKTVDDKRKKNGIKTRIPRSKKEKTTLIPDEIALSLSAPSTHDLDTPLGVRNALIMAIFLNNGLRCGEVAGLMTDGWDRGSSVLTFYRPKVKKEQKHYLNDWTAFLMTTWVYLYAVPGEKLLRRFDNQSNLSSPGLSERSLTKIVRDLGEEFGIKNLSAHDCRHYWATRAAQNMTDPIALQEAGGWNSLSMPRRYIEEQKIANAKIRLD